jgi:hypothetical protein
MTKRPAKKTAKKKAAIAKRKAHPKKPLLTSAGPWK